MEDQTKFEALSYRVIRLTGQVEDKVDDILARDVCHDLADVVFVRQEVFGGGKLPFEDRKKVLVKLLEQRHSSLWPKYRDLFADGGPIRHLQRLRNNLAHRSWLPTGHPDMWWYSSADQETPVMTVEFVAASGTFQKGRYQRHTLDIHDLTKGINLGEQAQERLTELFNELKLVRQSSDSPRPLDEQIGYETTEPTPLQW